MQVLKESFIGNGRTVMIANISPASSSCLETVNTLRCVHVFMHACMYTYVCMYVYEYMRPSACMYVSKLFEYMHDIPQTCVYLHTHTHTHMHACMHA